MKIGTVICGPDVAFGPLALFSGSFEEKTRKAAGLGFHGIELMVRDPATLDWGQVRSVLAANHLDVPQVVTGELFGADGLCLATPDRQLHEKALRRTCQVIDLAAYLGAMVNLGRLRGRLENLGSNAWQKAVSLLRPAALYAAEKQVKLTIEPINRYETDFILTAADGLRLLDNLGLENVGLMLDLFHMNIEEQSIEAGLRQAGKALWHVHIADSNRNYPGSGHLLFEPIFETLDGMGYSGYLSAELRPLPDADQAAEQTIRFLIAHNML